MMDPNWNEIAKKLINSFEQIIVQQKPQGYAVLVEWRNDAYIGSLQHIAQKYSNEIVLLSKTTNPIPIELKESLILTQKDITQIIADNTLDLEGRLHVIRMINNKLGIMTSNQTRYMQNNMRIIEEANTGDNIYISQTNLYVADNKQINPKLN